MIVRRESPSGRYLFTQEALVFGTSSLGAGPITEAMNPEVNSLPVAPGPAASLLCTVPNQRLDFLQVLQGAPDPASPELTRYEVFRSPVGGGPAVPTGLFLDMGGDQLFAQTSVFEFPGAPVITFDQGDAVGVVATVPAFSGLRPGSVRCVVSFLPVGFVPVPFE